jgi:hypothetical protein
MLYSLGLLKKMKMKRRKTKKNRKRSSLKLTLLHQPNPPSTTP